MSDTLLIQANLREKVGTGPARSLRATGNVPAVIYGKGEESKLFSMSQKEADMLYNQSQVRSAIVNIKIGDKIYVALPKQFSVHPVTDSVEHIDFMFVGDQIKKVRINIPIRIKGKEKSMGIKKGGVLNVVFRSIPCKVEKDKIPPFIEIDVSGMDVGVTLQLKDITFPAGVKLLIKDLNHTFLRLTGKRKVVEEAEIKAPTAEGGEEAKEEGSDKKEGDEKSKEGDEKKEDGGDKKEKK